MRVPYLAAGAVLAESNMVTTLSRRVAEDERLNRRVLRGTVVDSVVALNLAWLVNSAILVMAAGAFFVAGIEVTSLEQAHETAHDLQDSIRQRLGGADVLIHLEPEDRVRPGTEIRPARGG